MKRKTTVEIAENGRKNAKLEFENGDDSAEEHFIESDEEMVESDAPSTDTATVPQDKDALYKLPTHQEMSAISQTQLLFKSNLFKLQIQELLKNVQMDTKKQKRIQAVLGLLKEAMLSTEATKEVELHSFSLKQVQIPHPQGILPSKESQVKFKYLPPSQVYVIGSFMLKTIVKSREGFVVDLGVEMPSEMFSDKDYINYRYHHKRACFLAVIAEKLSSALPTDSYKNIKFEWMHADQRKAVLVLSVTDEVKIRIIPLVDSDVFPLHKLTPERCHVRPGTIGLDEASEPNPTPQYNSSILEDSLILQHLNFLHQQTKEYPGLVDAIQLCKVWLNQRGLSHGFILSMIAGHLIKHRHAGRNLSSYQIFKIVLELVSKHDLDTPLVLSSENELTLEVDDYANNFQVSIIDPLGKMNLAYTIPRQDFVLLQTFAKETFAQLQTDKDNFDSMFLKNHSSELMFDHVLTVAPTETEPLFDYVNAFVRASYETSNLLASAFKERLLSVRTETQVLQWDIDATSEIPTEFKLMVNVNPEEAFKSVLYGPEPTEDASQGFKALWGDKCEVRRFKDGAIKLCVVSQANNFYEKSLLIVDLMVYLISRHFGSVKVARDKALQLILGHETFGPVQNAFGELKRIFKALDLPLEIDTIMPISPSLRYTSLKPSEPCTVLLRFERSGKWPDNFEAIQEMKLALFARMAGQLQENGIPADIVLVPGNEGNRLEVQVNGIVFSCQIAHHRDLHLMDPDTEQHCNTLIKTEIMPDLSTRISNVCVASPVLSGVIRIVKRWFNAHLMSFVPEVFIEKLCIGVLARYSSVGCIATGFLRVLDFLSSFKWEESPLLLHFSEEERDQVEAKASGLFDKSRIKGHGKFMFIGSICDPECRLFDQGNDQSLAKRIKHLSKASIRMIQKDATLNAFVTPMDKFDSVLVLSSRYSKNTISNYFKNRQTRFKNVPQVDPDAQPVNEYVALLRKTFGSCCTIFHDAYLPYLIGINWTIKGDFKFKVGHSFAVSVADNSKKLVSLNKDSVLAEMVKMSNQLVQGVIVSSKDSE